MDESSSDIIVKYQKLAAEYSKLRAQIAVLKKAVSDEQTKSHELKEALKDKDQSIRKLEQEVECLNFRNLQLTKRVSVLQSDLESAEDRVKKTKTKLPNSPVALLPETQSVLNSELQSRIEENERLHQQMFESEVEYKKNITDLTMKVETLQLQLEQQHTSLSNLIKKQEETIVRLSQERAKFELTLKNYEKDMKDIKSKDEICKEELDFVKQELGVKLNNAHRIIEEKVIFNDTKWKNICSLNVPVLLHHKQEQLSKLMGEVKVVVSELIRRLSDLHTYMEQKIQSSEYRNNFNGVMNKFSSSLRESTSHLKATENAFMEFSGKIQKDPSSWLEISNLVTISSTFSRYVRYLDKLLPYLLISIEMEDNSRGTTPRLKEIYAKLKLISQKLIINFGKLEKYIELLVLVGCPNNSAIYHVSHEMLIKKVIGGLNSLELLFEDARKVFGSKVVFDSELPNATETVRITDDCILTSLVSISKSIRKITSLLEGKASILNCGIPFRARGARRESRLTLHPCVPELRNRGLRYISLLQQEEPPSIPYKLALQNQQTLDSYADSRESLTQQLQAYQNKLAKLELDKEHWMVECQLLKTRQSKQSNPVVDESGDGSQDSDETFHNFVKSSVNQLVIQIQLADSKVLAFQNECECLYQRLKLTEQKKEELEKQSSNFKSTIDQLQEEQLTLVKNYEDQLSTMSDHLATMNETLTSQKDEIEALKHAGNNKASKRSKGK